MPFDDRAALVATAKTLDITHEDPMLLIADENERQQRLFTDFRGVSVSASGGGQQQPAVAGWEGDVLVVESRMNHGTRLVRQYRIDAETGRLMISSAVELPNLQEVTFRLVYDRLTQSGDSWLDRGGATCFSPRDQNWGEPITWPTSHESPN